jgi:hypothetical protein
MSIQHAFGPTNPNARLGANPGFRKNLVNVSFLFHFGFPIPTVLEIAMGGKLILFADLWFAEIEECLRPKEPFANSALLVNYPLVLEKDLSGFFYEIAGTTEFSRHIPVFG